MRYLAHVVGHSDVRLWSLDAAERLRRQLEQVGGVTLTERLDALPADAGVLLLRADYLYEVRTLKGLLEQPGKVLLHPGSG
ncbi:MAG TPA: CDP-alcohol phosphatidyltransferase family protein, partial [Pseudomonadales bacterium]